PFPCLAVGRVLFMAVSPVHQLDPLFLHVAQRELLSTPILLRRWYKAFTPVFSSPPRDGSSTLWGESRRPGDGAGARRWGERVQAGARLNQGQANQGQGTRARARPTRCGSLRVKLSLNG